MSEISIKVNIGTRSYPLTIQPEEEDVIRQAAKRINESIKVLQENYAVKDIQDLLAMTALQFATQDLVKKPEALSEISEKTKSELNEINQLLDSALNEN